jgi:hypothetical protein
MKCLLSSVECAIVVDVAIEDAEEITISGFVAQQYCDVAFFAIARFSSCCGNEVKRYARRWPAHGTWSNVAFLEIPAQKHCLCLTVTFVDSESSTLVPILGHFAV